MRNLKIQSLIIKYSSLVIIAFLVSRILSAIIYVLYPNILTFRLNGEYHTYGDGYLITAIFSVCSLMISIFMFKDMRIIKKISYPILFLTLLSPLSGCMFFLILNYKQSKKINDEREFTEDNL